MRTTVLGAVILWTASVAVAQTPTFRVAPRDNLPGSVNDTTYLNTVIVADIGSPDGPPDGFVDLITANFGGANPLAPVKFGNGQGRFVNCCNVQILTVPTAIALGTFDGDLVPDLLVADSRNVRLQKGNGDGTFGTPGPAVPAGRGPAAILVADLNDDQKLDALVVDDADQIAAAAGAVTVLLGNGDGTFVTPGAMFTTGVGSQAGVLGDFNRDGKTDIAVANSGNGNVTVLFGDGVGGFTFGPVPQAGPEPVAIAAGNLNADVFLDLVVVNRNSDTITVIVGQQGGTFAAPRPFTSGSAGSTPTGLGLGDMNSDDKLDVVVVNSRSNDASVLLGDGQGNVARPRAFVSDQEPQAVAVQDFNGDEIVDVVTVNRGTASPNVGILLGVGDGSLVGVEDVVSQPSPTGVAVGDVDNDGVADFIAAHLPAPSTASGSALVFRADPLVGFAPPAVLSSAGDAVAIAAADFNADAVLDIVVVNKSTTNASVFLGRAAGGFGARRDFPTGAGATGAVAADWNLDGRADLAVARQGNGSTGAVDVLLANVDGSLRTPVSFPVGTSPVAIDFGDFTGDGRRDVVVANSVSNDVSVLRGNGDGTFQPATSVPSSGGPRAIAVADFDGDGYDDFAVARSINSNVALFYSNGLGGFTPGTQLGVSGSASAVAARDVTGDFIPDILVTDQVSNIVSAFYGTGTTRQFRHDSRVDDIVVSRGPVGVAAADVDGDGRYDGLAANGFLAGSVSVLTNISSIFVSRGDVNNDQRLSAADALATIRELGESNGHRIEDGLVRNGAYRAAVGVDANGDGFVTPQDTLALVYRLFPGL